MQRILLVGLVRTRRRRPSRSSRLDFVTRRGRTSGRSVRVSDGLQRPSCCQHWLRIWQLAKVFAAPRVAADALRVDEEGTPDVERTEADDLVAVDPEGTRRLLVPVGEKLLAAQTAALFELFR